MTAEKYFITSFVILVLTNMIFWTIGYNSDFLSVSSIISTLGLVAVVVIVGAFLSPSIKWVAMIMLIVGLLFSVTLPGPFSITIGFGLCSNILAAFSSDLTNILVIPYVFYSFLGIVALVSGILVTTNS